MRKNSLVGSLLNKTPVPYTAANKRFNLFQLDRNNREAQMRAMGSVGTLFAIVNRLSEATSQVEWKLWRKAESGLDEDRVEVTKHQALKVWDKPNPFMAQQEFIQTFEQHLDLVGEGWWIVATNPRVSFPLELWPVRPDRIEPVRDKADFLSGYIYRSPEGEKIPLRQEQVIQLRIPDPLDPYRGTGPVQSILADLDSTRYSTEWNRNFFINSAEPGGIVEVDRRLSDEEFNEMAERWGEQHRGVANAHKVAILEQAKWVPNAYTRRDMQFVELRNVSREIIREAYGIHGHMLGISESINRANAEAAEVTFSRWHLVPRLNRIKQALNVHFLPLFGSAAQGLEFDYCDPVPPDRETENKELTAKANAAKALAEAGWSPDDVLSAVGLPEMEYVGRRESEPALQQQLEPAPGLESGEQVVPD